MTIFWIKKCYLYYKILFYHISDWYHVAQLFSDVFAQWACDIKIEIFDRDW